jgi:hypothetical protein
MVSGHLFLPMDRQAFYPASGAIVWGRLQGLIVNLLPFTSAPAMSGLGRNVAM